ncbi:MAG: hypothetical protein AAF799_08925 [Myxococcota bacterium]
MDSHELAARARRAYELGRLRRAAWAWWPVSPVVVVALLMGHTATAVALAVPLVLMCVWCSYRGQGLERAITPGAVAGLLPAMVAMGTMQHFGCASNSCAELCAPLCAATGLVVGAWLGTKTAARETPRVTAASLAIAAVSASLGCAPIGLGTLVGAIVGMAVGVVPLWVVRHAAD